MPAPSKEFHLARGGTLRIWKDLVDATTLKALRDEMLEEVEFRRYRIHDTPEPRVHCLYHAGTTETAAEAQPGYRYGNVTLKARPLEEVPRIQQVAQSFADLCHVNEWNIGVMPICYRSGQDRMGKHADDDQGEELILTLLVDGPCNVPRRLVVEPSPKLFNKADLLATDEKLQVFLRPGDVYEMDGAMQKAYVHSVPVSDDASYQETEGQRRMSIVFRSGKFMSYSKDSGEPVVDVTVLDFKPSYRIGSIPGLTYGDVKTRKTLCALGAHLGSQRSISGNESFGCDAIVMSGTRQDGLEWDAFFEMAYAVESRKGGRALLKSFKLGLPVRIFRTSRIDPSIGRHFRGSAQMYRYDGLYHVRYAKIPKNEKTHPYVFYLRMANPDGFGFNFDRTGENDTLSNLPLEEKSLRLPVKPSYLFEKERVTRAEFEHCLEQARVEPGRHQVDNVLLGECATSRLDDSIHNRTIQKYRTALASLATGNPCRSPLELVEPQFAEEQHGASEPRGASPLPSRFFLPREDRYILDRSGRIELHVECLLIFPSTALDLLEVLALKVFQTTQNGLDALNLLGQAALLRAPARLDDTRRAMADVETSLPIKTLRQPNLVDLTEYQADLLSELCFDVYSHPGWKRRWYEEQQALRHATAAILAHQQRNRSGAMQRNMCNPWQSFRTAKCTAKGMINVHTKHRLPPRKHKLPIQRQLGTQTAFGAPLPRRQKRLPSLVSPCAQTPRLRRLLRRNPKLCSPPWGYTRRGGPPTVSPLASPAQSTRSLVRYHSPQGHAYI
jgi:alkylated DNA repair dioxygenase AlkB